MPIAVRAEDLSKVYRLGSIGTGTLSHDLHRWVAKARGKEDPFLKVGESNDKSKPGGDVVYSLRDINLEIEQGDAVGIIGRNGAGKSTLLKILSRVTSPSGGRINVKGRVASLLEVGTGFHPELTGKENIYLNGAILGMRKKEIDRKLDSIIEFSGVARYINTPVKRYSSGMYVRLAFAVAAHLESEILIVDEVLAVGDSEFQKKCLGKMDEVSRSEGRTILFVSHNIAAIRNLTQKVLYLKDGKMAEPMGRTSLMIQKYLEDNIKLSYEARNLGNFRRSERNSLATIEQIIVANQENDFSRINIWEDVIVELRVKVEEIEVSTVVNVIFKNAEGEVVSSISSYDKGKEFLLKKGITPISLNIMNHNFSPGKYFATIGLSPVGGGMSYDVLVDYPLFEIHNDNKLNYWLERPYGHLMIDDIVWSENEKFKTA